jgi:hypothetical protein
MVYFENAFRWSYFHHNLKMHGPSCKNDVSFSFRLRSGFKTGELNTRKKKTASWVGRAPDVAASERALLPTGSQYLVTAQAAAHSPTIRDAD